MAKSVVLDREALVLALLALIRAREGGRSVDLTAAREEAQRLLDESDYFTQGAYRQAVT